MKSVDQVRHWKLLEDMPDTSGNMERGELLEELIVEGGARIERIVSTGQKSPEGFWYDQPQGEWVALIQGSASLRFEQESSVRELVVGDAFWIPAHCRHRIESTSCDPPTVWIAVFVPEERQQEAVRGERQA
jgi:cupin 2 domain-containing protein